MSNLSEKNITRNINQVILSAAVITSVGITTNDSDQSYANENFALNERLSRPQ